MTEKGEGEIIVARRSSDEGSEPENYLPCYHCLGFYKTK